MDHSWLFYVVGGLLSLLIMWLIAVAAYFVFLFAAARKAADAIANISFDGPVNYPFAIERRGSLLKA